MFYISQEIGWEGHLWNDLCVKWDLNPLLLNFLPSAVGREVYGHNYQSVFLSTSMKAWVFGHLAVILGFKCVFYALLHNLYSGLDIGAQKSPKKSLEIIRMLSSSSCGAVPDAWKLLYVLIVKKILC